MHPLEKEKSSKPTQQSEAKRFGVIFPQTHAFRAESLALLIGSSTLPKSEL